MFLTMSRSVSSSLKWLKPFICGLGESLSDRMMTSSSSEDGGRFSLFILLDRIRTMAFKFRFQYFINQALILYTVDTKQHYRYIGYGKTITQINCQDVKEYINIFPQWKKGYLINFNLLTSHFPLLFPLR